jgi:hypothetical protein
MAKSRAPRRKSVGSEGAIPYSADFTAELASLQTRPAPLLRESNVVGKTTDISSGYIEVASRTNKRRPAGLGEVGLATAGYGWACEYGILDRATAVACPYICGTQLAERRLEAYGSHERCDSAVPVRPVGCLRQNQHLRTNLLFLALAFLLPCPAAAQKESQSPAIFSKGNVSRAEPGKGAEASTDKPPADTSQQVTPLPNLATQWQQLDQMLRQMASNLPTM